MKIPSRTLLVIDWQRHRDGVILIECNKIIIKRLFWNQLRRDLIATMHAVGGLTTDKSKVMNYLQTFIY